MCNMLSLMSDNFDLGKVNVAVKTVCVLEHSWSIWKTEAVKIFWGNDYVDSQPTSNKHLMKQYLLFTSNIF